jgi:hypothetical protein
MGILKSIATYPAKYTAKYTSIGRQYGPGQITLDNYRGVKAVYEDSKKTRKLAKTQPKSFYQARRRYQQKMLQANFYEEDKYDIYSKMEGLKVFSLFVYIVLFLYGSYVNFTSVPSETFALPAEIIAGNNTFKSLVYIMFGYTAILTYLYAIYHSFSARNTMYLGIFMFTKFIIKHPTELIPFYYSYEDTIEKIYNIEIKRPKK